MFNSLARSILSQQLAVKAASVIQGRFMALCQVRPALLTCHVGSPRFMVCAQQDRIGMSVQCEDFVTPEAVLQLDQEQLRGVGLSYAKVITVQELLDKTNCSYLLKHVPAACWKMHTSSNHATALMCSAEPQYHETTAKVAAIMHALYTMHQLHACSCSPRCWGSMAIGALWSKSALCWQKCIRLH